MQPARRILAIAGLAVAAACGRSAPAEPGAGGDPLSHATVGEPGRAVSSDILTAEPIPGGVRLRNRTASPIFFLASERGVLALILWAPCTSVERCAPVPPHGVRDVPDAEIVGQAATAREIAVLHWHARTTGGQAAPDSIRAVVVTR